jgi:hypothetical protein
VVGVEQGTNPADRLFVRLVHGRGHRNRLPVHASQDGHGHRTVGDGVVVNRQWSIVSGQWPMEARIGHRTDHWPLPTDH